MTCEEMAHDTPGGAPLFGEHSFRHSLPNTAERRDEVREPHHSSGEADGDMGDDCVQALMHSGDARGTAMGPAHMCPLQAQRMLSDASLVAAVHLMAYTGRSASVIPCVGYM